MSRNDTSSHTLIKQLYMSWKWSPLPCTSPSCAGPILLHRCGWSRGPGSNGAGFGRWGKAQDLLPWVPKPCSQGGGAFWGHGWSHWPNGDSHWCTGGLGLPKTFYGWAIFMSQEMGNLEFHNLKIFQDCSNTAYIIIIIIPQVLIYLIFWGYGEMRLLWHRMVIRNQNHSATSCNFVGHNGWSLFFKLAIFAWAGGCFAFFGMGILKTS